MTDDIIAQFIELFCGVDDFCLELEPEFNKKLLKRGICKSAKISFENSIRNLNYPYLTERRRGEVMVS